LCRRCDHGAKVGNSISALLGILTSALTEDINQANWGKIRKEIERELADKGAATRDLHALQLIATSTSEDVWITFYQSYLWWGRVREGCVLKDDISKYRELQDDWSNRDIAQHH
jgi:hypothetical protein